MWNSFLSLPLFLAHAVYYIRNVGWEDAPLADEGIEEAKQAGRNLKKHGFEYVDIFV